MAPGHDGSHCPRQRHIRINSAESRSTGASTPASTSSPRPRRLGPPAGGPRRWTTPPGSSWPSRSRTRSAGSSAWTRAPTRSRISPVWSERDEPDCVAADRGADRPADAHSSRTRSSDRWRTSNRRRRAGLRQLGMVSARTQSATPAPRVMAVDDGGSEPELARAFAPRPALAPACPNPTPTGDQANRPTPSRSVRSVR